MSLFRRQLPACRMLLMMGVLAASAWSLHKLAVADDKVSTEPTFPPESLEFFEKKIRPILAERCHDCHGAEKQEGSLRLDSRESILAGGDSGPAVTLESVDDSLLIDAIRYGDLYQMPPKQQLPAQEIALLEEWVRRGAPWPAGDSAAPVATAKAFDLAERKRSHWAWAPVASPAIPTLPSGRAAATPIDAFLLARLEAAKLQRAPLADKRILLRRATFDLIGLPPTPAEIAAFESDPSPEAFARVVDRLLASPHFGERWARHWLDLVRYAETMGHEFDYPIAGAWRYRDYVICAFNADLPYDQFVREHLAGDLLPAPRRHPTEGYNESIIATAFWYFGEALHAPVDSQADYAARIDNQIDVASKTFLGLTVACARCHDHKFDAISTKDYYALAGYIASSHQQFAPIDAAGRIEVSAGELANSQQKGREVFTRLTSRTDDRAADLFARCLLASRSARDVSDGALRDEIAAHHGIDRALLERFIAASAEPDAQEPGHPLYAWSNLAAPHLPDESFLTRRSTLAAGLEQRLAQVQATTKGEVVFEDFAAGLDRWFPTGWAFGTTTTRGGDWRPTPNGPQLLPAGFAESSRTGDRLPGVIRSRTFTLDKPFVNYRLAGRSAQVRLVVDGYMMDQFTELLFEGLSFKVDGEEQRWHSQSVAKHLGHRAHIELIDRGDGYIAVDKICFADAPAIDRAQEEITPTLLAQPDVASAETLARAYGEVWAKSLRQWREGEASAGAEFVRWALSQRLLPDAEAAQGELARLSEQAALANEHIPEPQTIVAMCEGSGEDVPVHIRGSHKNLGEVVPRRLLEAIAGPDQPATPRGSGRLELAQRMLAPDNPFTARVMVNRLWHHLFGRGIVATVDNFGLLGETPTHPELLDYLATRFVAQRWSVKRLLREMMLTEAYQLASVGPAPSAAQDPQNLLLHRANVRRLEGEVIRDSLLAISGQLDRTQFGPSVPIHLTPFMDGRGRPEQSGPLDGNGRRSIYVEVRRNFLSPAMLAFDAPSPSSTTGRRNLSNVPAQALIMMNDQFVADQSRLWAERMLATPNLSHDARIKQLYLTAYGRDPSPPELKAAAQFIAEQVDSAGVPPDDVRSWTDLCHVLTNVKEFIFVQ